MDALTLAPPVIAIGIALCTRNVPAALGVALFASELLLSDFRLAVAGLSSVQRITVVIVNALNNPILMICAALGALALILRTSQAAQGLAGPILRSGFAKTRQRAELTVAATGTLIFIAPVISLITAGILGRQLYDQHGLSRARLAYMIDSTSAPVCTLILFNAWGALALSLIAPYEIDRPVATLAQSVVWNFYALLTLAGVYFTALSGRGFGPLKTVRTPQLDTPSEPEEPPTQNDTWINGLHDIIPVIGTILFALAFGESVRALGAGMFLSNIVQASFPPALVPVMIFFAAAATSFTTGTSWGTYAIMIPLALPLSQSLGIPPALAIATVLGGGVFGDHCSPISDTTLIASIAAGVDHLEHVKTQLPYALMAAALSAIFYGIAGAVIAS